MFLCFARFVGQGASGDCKMLDDRVIVAHGVTPAPSVFHGCVAGGAGLPLRCSGVSWLKRTCRCCDGFLPWPTGRPRPACGQVMGSTPIAAIMPAIYGRHARGPYAKNPFFAPKPLVRVILFR